MSRTGHAAQVWLHVDDDKAEQQDVVCQRTLEEFYNRCSDCFQNSEKLAQQTVATTLETSCPVLLSSVKTSENHVTARPRWLLRNSGVYRLFHGFLTGKKNTEPNNERKYRVVPPSAPDPPKR
ncbi:unnamed protein product [Lymnaea stagnalis]|uniref:Uncharacterized protein n=1 Tax=Lymnaea stagnalis TaxID=6523 RepID=A0AAV2HPH7_LYMST